LIVNCFNFNVEVGGLVKNKKSRCLGYFRLLSQEADVNQRAPLAGSVVCLGNFNRAFKVPFGPESHNKEPNNRADAHCAQFFPLGIWGLCGNFRARIRPQMPSSSCPGIQPSRPEERAGSFRPPRIACESNPNTEILYFHETPTSTLKLKVLTIK
jgi:hypothetical protein